MKLGAIDHAAACFKHKNTTPIRGQPTKKSLKWIQIELQENVSSVETNIGEGNHVYLGLLNSDEEHALVPKTQQFVAPTHPVALQIPFYSTPAEALELKNAHAEKKTFVFRM